MNSASKNWIFFLIALVLFNCGSQKQARTEVKKIVPIEKAYVLLRTEGNNDDISQLKDILNSDFVTNNISTNIVTYPLGRVWNNNQIFTTAYNDNYDYIVLIDQVAKFTIDNKTQVGGKYQIRSYHIKSANPDWIDLGQKTCNVTVKPSIKKFAQQIVSNIVPNYKSSTFSLNEDEEYAENSNDSNNSGYQTFKSSKEIDTEIEELKRQLKIEKEKTEKVLAEKERLAKQYEKALAKEKQKTELALANLEIAKKKKEAIAILEEQKVLDIKKQRQKEIAKSYESKRKEIKQREVEEALKNPTVVLAEKKEPTREERIKERQEAKKRLAEERAIIRKKQEEDAFKRQEEKRRLAELKRNEQKREQEALLKKKNEEKLLAQTKKEEELSRLKKLKEEKRITQLNKSKQIEAEKEKARSLEKKRLEKQLKDEKVLAESKRLEKLRIEQDAQIKKLEAEQKLKETLKEKKRLAKLENAKKLKKEKLSREEKRLVQQKKEAEEFELREKKRLAQIKEKEKTTKKSVTKNSSKTKKKTSNNKTSNNNIVNTLVVLRGKKDDANNLKKLQDNIEFDFLFAKRKATTQIYSKEQNLNKESISRNNISKYDFIIIVDQLDYKGEGYSNYQISTINSSTDSEWKNQEIQSFNISDRNSVKKLSKTITNSL